jgi:hypothetical protein
MSLLVREPKVALRWIKRASRASDRRDQVQELTSTLEKDATVFTILNVRSWRKKNEVQFASVVGNSPTAWTPGLRKPERCSRRVLGLDSRLNWASVARAFIANWHGDAAVWSDDRLWRLRDMFGHTNDTSTTLTAIHQYAAKSRCRILQASEPRMRLRPHGKRAGPRSAARRQRCGGSAAGQQVLVRLADGADTSGRVRRRAHWEFVGVGRG